MQGDSLRAPQGWLPPAAGPAGYQGLSGRLFRQAIGFLALDGN
jgi:hypothetical protein